MHHLTYALFFTLDHDISYSNPPPSVFLHSLLMNRNEKPKDFNEFMSLILIILKTLTTFQPSVKVSKQKTNQKLTEEFAAWGVTVFLRPQQGGGGSRTLN